MARAAALGRGVSDALEVAVSHTPGPWTASALLTADDGWTFCSVGPFQVEGNADHVEDTIAEVSGINHDALSNAHLIIAAPDLLAAASMVLSKCVSMVEDHAFFTAEDALKALAAAVAKAEGR